MSFIYLFLFLFILNFELWLFYKESKKKRKKRKRECIAICDSWNIKMNIKYWDKAFVFTNGHLDYIF